MQKTKKYRFALSAIALIVGCLYTMPAKAKAVCLESDDGFFHTDGTCPAACDKPCPSAPKPQKRMTPLASPYTLEPKEEEFQLYSKQRMFEPQSVDKSGAIFDSGPCKSCEKSGAIFDTGPCETCDKNGAIFETGPCETCDKNGSILGGAPCDGPSCKPAEVNPKYIQNYIVYDDFLYSQIQPKCEDTASLQLEFVDFRLKDGKNEYSYSNKLGKYRFRIFGCRRDSKDAILNEGRILEKDMRFVEIFNDMVSDCYNIVNVPNDLCLKKDTPLPEYILTAEITDFYMNICDNYNWNKAQKTDERDGTSEIKVVWRILDTTKRNVLWKGKSIGYGEVHEGEKNGEIMLIERAFADAVSNLRAQPDFENMLAKRVSNENMLAQRDYLINKQIASNPIKCQYEEKILSGGSSFSVIEDGGSASSGFGVQDITAKDVNITITDAQSITPNKTIGIVVAPIPVPVEASGATAAFVASGVAGAADAILEGSGSLAGFQEVAEGAGSSTSAYANGQDITKTGEVVESAGIDGAGFINLVDGDQKSITASSMADNKLCIVEHDDYDNLGPENVYRVRSAVVSVANASGKKGAGLLVSEQFIMTSADLINKDNNIFDIETISGVKAKAKAFRINPSQNTALLVLDEPVNYTPLTLNLDLPSVGAGDFMTIGLSNFEDSGEGYLENNVKVSGYRYGANQTAEIVADTFVQAVTVGGVLIDDRGRVVGMSHKTKDSSEFNSDLFLPIESALKSLGVDICGKAFEEPKVLPQKSWRKPVAELIDSTTIYEPEEMVEDERK